MKKVMGILTAIVLLLAMAGCSTSDDGSVVVDPNASAGQSSANGTAGTSASSGASAAVQDELYYDANGVKIHTYDVAADVLASLGKPKGTFEADSCAYQGKDLFYYYNGFQLTVNNVDGADHVTAIMIVDDTVSNPQGVKIGSSEEDMLQRMGDDYTSTPGLYAFISGNTTLQIQVKEGKVAGILYVYTPQS